jgi:lysophospholipase L1-like esterase
MVLARLPAAVLAVVCLPAAAAAKSKIACVGASTTSGDGSSAGHHYPDELQRLEGTDAEVKNFGVSGTTMLRAVAASYWNTPALGQALAYGPDVAIIWFGGNDAKPENWTTHKGEFLGDYEAMIRMFQALPSHPRTFVVLSLLTRDTEGIPKAVVDAEVVPLCRQAAAETGSGVVDVHDDLAAHPEYFPDGIHPNDMGTVAVAKLVYAALSAAADAGVADGPADAVTPAADAGSDAAAMPSPPLPDAEVPDAPAVEARVVGAAGATASGGAAGGTAGAGGAPGSGAHAPSGGGGCAAADGASTGVPALLVLIVAIATVTRRRRGPIWKVGPSGGHS